MKIIETGSRQILIYNPGRCQIYFRDTPSPRRALVWLPIPYSLIHRPILSSQSNLLYPFFYAQPANPEPSDCQDCLTKDLPGRQSTKI